MRKRGYLIFSIISFLCAFFAIAGGILEEKSDIVWSYEFVVWILITSALIGLGIGILLTNMLILCEKKFKINDKRKKFCLKKRFVFCFSLGGILLIWIPVFLAFYPGNCTYDIGGQTWYMVSNYYEAHHPLAHTLLMEFFVNIGLFLENANLGMAMYVLLQLIWLAASFAVCITLLYSEGIRSIWLVILQLWAMFFIPNWYMSISTTKDVIFSACVLLMLICFCYILRKKRETLRLDVWDIGFSVNGILMVLFRNNGKYALLLVLVCLIGVAIFSKRNKRLFQRLILCCFFVLLVGNGILGLLSHLTNATDVRKEEMLSVPVQQLSRVMCMQKGISEEDKEIIDGFIINQAYENYIPSISDPVKSNLNLSYVVNHKKQFVDMYFRLMLKYPSTYINAVLALDAGYLNPFDMTHTDVYTWGAKWLRLGWSPNEELGMEQTPLLLNLNEFLVGFAENDKYLEIPLLGYMVMPGGYLWMCIYFVGWLIWRKKYICLLPISYLLGYYITLLLGPTVQLRYVYTVMITLPFLVVYMIGERVNGGEVQHG